MNRKILKCIALLLNTKVVYANYKFYFMLKIKKNTRNIKLGNSKKFLVLDKTSFGL